MKKKNRAVHQTPRSKAAQRRDRIASILLGVIVIACVVLTIVAWRLK